MIRLRIESTGVYKSFSDKVLRDGSAIFDFDNNLVVIDEIEYEISSLQSSNKTASYSFDKVVIDNEAYVVSCNSITLYNKGDYIVTIDTDATLSEGESITLSNYDSIIVQTISIAFTGTGTTKCLEVMKETIKC